MPPDRPRRCRPGGRRGAGSLDRLVCYRPGKGVFSIIEKKTDANNPISA